MIVATYKIQGEEGEEGEDVKYLVLPYGVRLEHVLRLLGIDREKVKLVAIG